MHDLSRSFVRFQRLLALSLMAYLPLRPIDELLDMSGDRIFTDALSGLGHP